MKPGACGWCGSEDTHAEFVDIGIGQQQVTPAQCNHCGASEIGPYIDDEDIDAEDGKRGWYAGEQTLEVIEADVRASEIRARDFNNGERMLVEHEGTVHQAFKRLSWSEPTFQMLCGIETEVAQRPSVDAITCFECIAYWAKGKP